MNRFACSLGIIFGLWLLAACSNAADRVGVIIPSMPASPTQAKFEAPVQPTPVASATRAAMEITPEITPVNTASPLKNHALASGKAVEIQNMTTSRAVHTATLLANGKVLIAGGFDEHGNYLSSAEIYDPQTRSFTTTGSMSVARCCHTATLLPDGKVLIAGGFNGNYLDGAELYNPATGLFDPTGPMIMARHGQVAVLLGDGNVLLAGGVGTGYTFLATAELYHPASGSFTAAGSMTTPRESHTATLLENGKVLITGGHQGRHAAIEIYASAELYDPAEGVFTLTGNMTIKRHKHDATLLLDGRVLITGGADERDDRGIYTSSELYDPATGVFSPAARLNAGRYKHKGTSVLLRDGRVLLIGGASSTEIYDPKTGACQVAGSSTGATRLFATSVLLPDGEVFFAGGYGKDISASAQAWIFKP